MATAGFSHMLKSMKKQEKVERVWPLLKKDVSARRVSLGAASASTAVRNVNCAADPFRSLSALQRWRDVSRCTFTNLRCHLIVLIIGFFGRYHHGGHCSWRAQQSVAAARCVQSIRLKLSV